MEDIASKITELLNDPEGMENIKNMAESIFKENNISLPESSPSNSENSLLNPQQMASLMSILGQFNSQQKDDRTNLLMALRPHLSDARKERLDRAVKMMRLYSLLPLVQQSGLLNLF